MGVTAEPVELGDDELRAPETTRLERFGQRRAVGMLAALDLGELSDEAPAAAVQEVLDGFALCCKAEARAALAFCADPVVGDERPLGHAEPLTWVMPDTPRGDDRRT